MYWFIALISLFAMAVDALFYRLRIRRRVKSRAGRIAFVCFALVSDLMPAFILLLYRLQRLKSRRNAALPKSTKERLSCEQKSEMETGVVILHRGQRTPEV